MENEKVYAMPLGKVYSLLLNKALKKGRTKEEVDTVIQWLTGNIRRRPWAALVESPMEYGRFFRRHRPLTPTAAALRERYAG